MKIKTSELIGIPLDWVVAKCEGFVPAITTVAEQAENFHNAVHFDGSKPSQEAIDAVISVLKPRVYRNADKLTPIPNYSTDWSKGGPIIEIEQIGIVPHNEGSLQRCTFRTTRDGETFYHYGSTVLVAAMRCYVTYTLGTEVEIPDELI